MPVQIGKVVWPGVVGIGAGLVKSGQMLLSFAEHADSVEVGSITRHLREGNPGQVVWKYPEERALRHNAGLPNMGAEHAVEELARVQYQMKVPWGLNVAVTPGLPDTEAAAKDIAETATIMLGGGLRPDWLTLNVSSPDSDDPVEMLSNPQRAARLIEVLQPTLDLYNQIPLWLKVPPVLKPDHLKLLAEVVAAKGVGAVICGNAMDDMGDLAGGWCGEPIRAHARAGVWQWRRATGEKIPVVATGGVFDGKQVQDKLAVGAAAVQVVSALLFRGREAAETIRREYELLVAKDLEKSL